MGNFTKVSAADRNGELADRLLRREAEIRISLQDIVKAALEKSKAPLRQTGHNFVFKAKSFIPDRAEIAKAAGKRIVYSSLRESENRNAVENQINPVFDHLGDEIDARLKQK